MCTLRFRQDFGYNVDMTVEGIEAIEADARTRATVLVSSVPDIIKYIREQCNYSKTDLAKKIGVTRNCIIELESGKRKPQLITFCRLIITAGQLEKQHSN